MLKHFSDNWEYTLKSSHLTMLFFSLEEGIHFFVRCAEFIHFFAFFLSRSSVQATLSGHCWPEEWHGQVPTCCQQSEVHPCWRQAQRLGRCRQGHLSPHFLWDVGQLVLRWLLQGWCYFRTNLRPHFLVVAASHTAYFALEAPLGLFGWLLDKTIVRSCCEGAGKTKPQLTFQQAALLSAQDTIQDSSVKRSARGENNTMSTYHEVLTKSKESCNVLSPKIRAKSVTFREDQEHNSRVKVSPNWTLFILCQLRPFGESTPWNKIDCSF